MGKDTELTDEDLALFRARSNALNLIGALMWGAWRAALEPAVETLDELAECARLDAHKPTQAYDRKSRIENLRKVRRRIRRIDSCLRAAIAILTDQGRQP